MTQDPSKTSTKDLEYILKKINDITRNQIIIDFLILIQGINFLIHPETAHKGIIESLAIATFFASISIIIGFIVTHGFKRRNFRVIAFASFFILLSVIIYFTAGFFAPAFHYFIALAVIVSSFSNIFSTYHLTKLAHAKKSLEPKLLKQSVSQPITGVATAIKNTTKLEAERVLSPAIFFSERVAKFRYGQLFINLLLIIIGILMLFFRFPTNAILLRVSGTILIFSALADLVALLWTHRESTFVHDLTHPSSRQPK